MILDIVLVIAGLVVLVFAGDILVRGAVALSLRLGVPPLIVSLTIVALGTSAPELVIAVQSAIEGAPGIAFGNIVGSNIANVWLVLGVPALIYSISASGDDVKRSFLIMLAVTALFIVLCFMGPFGIPHALVLLLVLTVVLVDTLRLAKNTPDAEPDDLPDVDPNARLSRTLGMIAIGLIGLPFGAELLIRGATDIARIFEISDLVIGLTIVAIGTSLPELATTVTAALRKQTDIALGNVIGSNMFNILAIMGVTSFFGPLDLPAGFLEFDVWVMALAAVTLVPFVMFGVRMGKRWGIVLVLTYVLYIVSIAIPHSGV